MDGVAVTRIRFHCAMHQSFISVERFLMWKGLLEVSLAESSPDAADKQ